MAKGVSLMANTTNFSVGGFPFEVRLEQPNKETIAAMLEAERIAHDPTVKHYSAERIAHDPTVKHYSDVEEALQELKR
ncbi:MAG: hypothetical protein U0H60_04810 [Lachnospiraceae bacterium]|nr:hypothetical protein [Lachnospiraceae bacterium]